MTIKPLPPYSGWSLTERDPAFIKAWLPFWGWFYHHYFRVESDGWEHIPTQGAALLVGTHNGGLAAPDMFMAMYDWYRQFGCDRLCYGLMHPKVWQFYRPLAELAVRSGAIMAHPQMAIAALRQQACVLVYPGGAQDVFRPYWQRNRIHFADRKGFIKLALREQVPLVPIISWGAHDTLFVLADLYEPMQKLLKTCNLPWLFNIDPEVFPIYLGLPWGISIGPLMNFPLPRKIWLRVCPAITFDRYGRAAARDLDYVETCYQIVLTTMQHHLDCLIQEAELAPTA
ncbi:acyltransferase family protein [Trichothermofontia sichuanensis B231]|uniref:lysophospholipid acyltransferase family protein n=1 Tax=Trichothermofontia sichuanensis TaxID=3045816 RepID=UPI0022467A02|nr:lysophospholipid acyltransferase family protein [Trichothermofontia sichuanensis]UZQ53224.1 acyltransferase family protein [Trichothermofontia sichuanensis B231]